MREPPGREEMVLAVRNLGTIEFLLDHMAMWHHPVFSQYMVTNHSGEGEVPLKSELCRLFKFFWLLSSRDACE